MKCARTPVEELLDKVPIGLSVGMDTGERSWSNYPVGGLSRDAAKEIRALRKEVETLSAEGAIKNRALNVAIRELNNWASYIADLPQGAGRGVIQDIGRTLDQCRNARHGSLSTDP
ncbi:hypothetical protein LCGC14_2069840 [marine sediment metagenome]|uniref:Uncharacterized protein n=1 Tax=marine sediment metagenome TaxID=412755 RepID=A0A0F9EIM2_9ZZZZ